MQEDESNRSAPPFGSLRDMIDDETRMAFLLLLLLGDEIGDGEGCHRCRKSRWRSGGSRRPLPNNKRPVGLLSLTTVYNSVARPTTADRIPNG
jgi:hypothetical protein